MEQPAIFSATLGLSYPWKVTAVNFSGGDNRLDITVDFDFDHCLACPECGRNLIPSDIAQETWHHRDFLRYSTYLHARIPHLECDCGATFPIERPWSRPGSRFMLVQ